MLISKSVKRDVCWGVGEGEMCGVWGSVGGGVKKCGERCVDVCWGVGGNEKRCWQR